MDLEHRQLYWEKLIEVKSDSISRRIFKRYLALPTDHGSWVFILSPLLIGIFAGGTWRTASGVLILAAFAAFLIRQPITIALKVYRGRRNKRDLTGAWFWTTFYSLVGSFAAIRLYQLGYAYLLFLALPGIPVFIWHLYLVSRRAERRQPGIEILGAGVLSLAAPAAYWIGEARADPVGWLLFILIWLQSASSIVHAYMRLAQREERPALWQERMRLGQRALVYTSFNLLFVIGLSGLNFISPGVILAYSIQWAETIYGMIKPANELKPTQIGVRQLIVSTLFTIVFIITWK